MIEKEASDLLARLGDAWSCLDIHAVASLWDREDPAPFLIAEEWPPCQDWEGVKAYLDAFPAMVYSFRIAYTLLGCKTIGEGMAYIHFMADWVTRTDSTSPPMAGQNRGSALLRLRQGEWRICGFVEAPLAPTFYMRWLAQKYAETGSPLKG